MGNKNTISAKNVLKSLSEDQKSMINAKCKYYRPFVFLIIDKIWSLIFQMYSYRKRA